MQKVSKEMIENIDEGFVMSCDGCSYYEDFEIDRLLEVNSFKDMIKEAKSRGWRFQFNDEKWEHYCFECAK